MADEPLEEYDVAVVVFCRARGVDEDDAAEVARYAVRHALTGGKRQTIQPLEIPLPPHLVEQGFTAPVLVAGVTPLGRVGGQGIRLVVTAEPYRNAGMGKPKKGGQD